MPFPFFECRFIRNTRVDMSKKTIKFISLVAFIAVAYFSIRVFHLDRYLDQESLRRWIASYGIWGPVVYIAIYSIAPSLMVPGLALTVAGGVLFGPLWGSLYVLTGATIGASVAFFIARYMGKAWVEGMIEGGRLKEVYDGVEKQGWRIVAFTRLIPLFPYNLLNYAYGMTNIRFVHYLIATFIFMIPGVVAYVVFSSSILDVFKGHLSKEFIIGAVLVVAVSLIPVLYRKYKILRHK